MDVARVSSRRMRRASRRVILKGNFSKPRKSRDVPIDVKQIEYKKKFPG